MWPCARAVALHPIVCSGHWLKKLPRVQFLDLTCHATPPTGRRTQRVWTRLVFGTGREILRVQATGRAHLRHVLAF